MRSYGAVAGRSVLVLTVLVFLTGMANASLVNLGPGSITPVASTITFDEVPLGTTNPVYNFTSIPDLGNVTVSFGGAFVGQTVCNPCFPVTLTQPIPTGPLTLDPTSPDVFTTNDVSATTSPTLSGSPQFNGPISVLFSTPVAGVALTGGFFDAVGSTSIQAFDVNGNSLGLITNSITGFEFYGLADSSGQNVIAGISFYVTGNEPAGFEIDNLTFGAARAFNVVPEPGTMFLLPSAIFALGLLRRGFRRG